MNLDELRSVQAKERRKDSLQHLRDAFYDDVAAYVNDLRAARDRRADQVSNPFSDDDVRRMSDELETAEEVAEALYERRVGKVVKLASFAAADMPVETEGMTTEERALFDDLVERIEANKATVLSTLAGEAPSQTSETDGATDTNVPPAPDSNVDANTEARGANREEIANAEAERAAGAEPGGSAEPDPTTTADPTVPGGDDVLAGAMGADTDSTPERDGDRSVSGDRTTTGNDAAVGDTPIGDTATSDTAASDAAPAGGTTDTPAVNGTAGPDRGTTTQTEGTVDTEDRTSVEPEPAPPGAPGVNGSSADATSAHDSVDEVSSETARESASGGEEGRIAATERETVRITRDVGAILGVDEREYELTSEDVVDLPTANAEPLVQRDAAERID